jgi:hypothetical protein
MLLKYLKDVRSNQSLRGSRHVVNAGNQKAETRKVPEPPFGPGTFSLFTAVFSVGIGSHPRAAAKITLPSP